MPYTIPPVSCWGFIRPIIYNERWFLSQLKIRLSTAEGTWLYSNCSWDLMHSWHTLLICKLLFVQGLTEGFCLSSGTTSLFHWSKSNPSHPRLPTCSTLAGFKNKPAQKQAAGICWENTCMDVFSVHLWTANTVSTSSARAKCAGQLLWREDLAGSSYPRSWCRPVAAGPRWVLAAAPGRPWVQQGAVPGCQWVLAGCPGRWWGRAGCPGHWWGRAGCPGCAGRERRRPSSAAWGSGAPWRPLPRRSVLWWPSWEPGLKLEQHTHTHTSPAGHLSSPHHLRLKC